jgi:hypothetical protein
LKNFVKTAKNINNVPVWKSFSLFYPLNRKRTHPTEVKAKLRQRHAEILGKGSGNLQTNAAEIFLLELFSIKGTYSQAWATSNIYFF